MVKTDGNKSFHFPAKPLSSFLLPLTSSGPTNVHKSSCLNIIIAFVSLAFSSSKPNFGYPNIHYTNFGYSLCPFLLPLVGSNPSNTHKRETYV